MYIRSFIALPVPDSISAELGDLTARLASQDKDRRVRWVDEENFHITLSFLGEIEESRLDDLASELGYSLDGFGEVDLRVESLALFPYGKRPRLVAAMLETSAEILALQRATVRAVRHLSIPVEKRRFHPHITLGRMRRGGGRIPDLPPSLTTLKGAMRVVTIYQSTLTPHGSIYDPLYEIPLDTPAAQEYA